MTSETQDTTNKVRIYVGLTEVAGTYTRIVEVLRKDSYPISFSQTSNHPFSYESIACLSDYKYESQLKISRKNPHFFLKLFVHVIIRFHHMLWAIKNFDCFFFVNGKSFLPNNIDLYVLRALRKKVIALVAHGSEARPAYMDGAHWRIALERGDPIKYVYKVSQRQHRHLLRLERLSSEVIANQLTSHFLTRRAIDAMRLGNPCVKSSIDFPSNDKPSTNNKTKIIHAPSDRRAKGSDAIGKMIERLKVDFPELAYIELVNQSNSDVLRELRSADLVIDQMYSDTFLAGLGVEAGSFGVPVLVGNYGVEILKKLYPHSAPPCFVVHPDNLESKLGELLQNAKALREIGAQAQFFLLSRQSPEEVAKRFVDIANSDVPESWYFLPCNVSYIHGSGLSEKELAEIAQLGLSRFGDKFFRLKRRPDLVEMITKLINSKKLEQ